MLMKELDDLARNLEFRQVENLLAIVSSSLARGDFTVLEPKKTSIGSSCLSASGFFTRGWAVFTGKTENLLPFDKH